MKTFQVVRKRVLKMNDSFENGHAILTIDQVLIYPIGLNLFCSISHLILIIIGIPINLIVIVVMLTSKRLKQKPRNILFLGVSIASLSSLITIMFELIAHHYQSPIFCKLNGLCSGVAYTCLLKFLLLALLDRYLAIVRPLLHRKIVTVRNVRIIQTIGSIAIYFGIKWPFIFGVASLQCGSYLLVEAKTLAMHQSVLILLCFVFYVLVYFKTKHYTRPNRVVSVSFVSKHASDPHRDGQIVIDTSLKSCAENQSSSRTASVRKQSTESALQVHGGSRKMEVEATYTLLAGVSSLLVFSAPVIVVFFIDWGCHLILSEAEDQEQCATFSVSFPYFRELLFYHLIYHPIMYMLRSKEFSSALVEKWRRLFRCHRPPDLRSYTTAGTIKNLRQTQTVQLPINNLD